MIQTANSIRHAHQLAMVSLALGMLITIGLAHQGTLRAQLTGSGTAVTGSGATVTGSGANVGSGGAVKTYGWAPNDTQRQNAEIVIAGVHDEVRVYTRSPSVADLHGSAPTEAGFFRKIIDKIASWFGLTDK